MMRLAGLTLIIAAHSAILAATQTIAFDPIPNHFLGSSPFPIVAQGSPGKPVTFTSTTPAVCKTAGNLVTLKSAGSCSITASGGGFVSVTRSFNVSLAKPAAFFIGQNSIAASPPSYTVVVADFNGDGKADFATTNESASTVSVMLGDGAGGFTAAPTIPFAALSYPRTIVAGDFNGDNIPDFAVSLVGVSGVAILLGDGAGGFTSSLGSPFATDPSPFCLVAGDFNGDGILDLITANFDSNSLTVLLGNGSGSFSATSVTLTGAATTLFSIAVGDFNGDGIQDIVAAGTDGQFLTILLGNGKSAFTSGAPVSAGAGVVASTVAVGDFNGDGIPDLATENRDSTITILLGDGSGGFALQAGTLPLVEYPSSILVGDFNGDGIQDLVIPEPFSARLRILHGDGTGQFSPDPSGPFAASGDVQVVAAADFNGDGIPDLVLPNGTVVLGFNAAGQSHQTISFAPLNDIVYSYPLITIIDVSATSGLPVTVESLNPDVCLPKNTTLTFGGTGQCTLFANQPGNDMFAAAPTVMRSFNVTPAQQSIAFSLPASVIPPPLVFALNGISTSQYSVSYFSTTPAVCTVSGMMATLIEPGTCSITAMQPGGGNYYAAPNVTQSFSVGKGFEPTVFDAIPTQLFGISPFAITAQTPDGVPVSIASNTPGVCSTASNLVSLVRPGICTITASQTANALYNASAPVTRTFTVRNATAPVSYLQPDPPVATGGSPSLVVVGDFNVDGIPDVVINNGIGIMNVLLGSRSGRFTLAPGSPYELQAHAEALVTGDFNEDGFPDLAIAAANHGVEVLLGDGSGNFTLGGEFATSVSPVSLVVGDFNGDAVQDLAMSNAADLTITVLLGNGSGRFTQALAGPRYIGAAGPLVAGDFNGDGIQDLAVIDPLLSTLTVLLGNGSGGFSVPDAAALSIGPGSRALAVGDFNGDGNQDLAIAQPGSGVLVFLGDGHGGFASARGNPFPAGAAPVSIVVADFNGDGIQDLATANQSDNDITIFLGDGNGGFTTSPASPLRVGTSPLSLAAADLNGDGMEDLVTANSLGNNYTVLFGQPIGATPQTIAFAPLPNLSVATPPFTLTAISDALLPVILISNTPNVCSVSGTTLTILIAGNCSIGATQPGNTIYAPAIPATQGFTVVFSDVAPTDNDYAAINAMSQHGITAGCGNNNFCPNQNVTRDETAIFIVRAIYGSDNFTYTATPYFTDVTPATFGFRWIQKLRDLGMTSGCTATTYCPGDVVPRDQMAILIVRARLGVSFTYPSTLYFTDATAANEFAFPWIQRMKLDNITNGCTATTYCPSAPVTRGEMAIFIMRAAFNQLLPAGTPVIAQIGPSTIAAGTSGVYTITGMNTHFVRGATQLGPIPGVTIGAINVTSPTTMTVQLSDAGGVPTQPCSLLVSTGSEQAVLPNGLLLQ